MYDTSPTVVFDKVTFRYKSRYTREFLLKELSLRVGSQERVALIGSNGSGKTTVIRLALGLDVPYSGTIQILEKTVSLGAHFPDVGYIGDPAQSDGSLGLPLWLTVKEITDAHCLLRGSSMPHDFAKNIFKRLKLSGLENREICFLSSGERRRLMTYLAVSKGPRLLIADEATEIVDKEDRPVIIECVQRCCDEFGTSLLWISHDSDSTAQITDRTVILENGQARCMPDRKLLFTVERNGQAQAPELIRESCALYQIRAAIEKDDFQSLHLTLKQTEGN